ncbi:MAG: S8 family serine peptidase [Bacteroidota bacterium]
MTVIFSIFGDICLSGFSSAKKVFLAAIFLFLSGQILLATPYYLYLQDVPTSTSQQALFFEEVFQELALEEIPIRHYLSWIQAISVDLSLTQLERLRSANWVASIEPVSTGKSSRIPTIRLDVNPKFDTLLSMQRGLMYLDTLAAHGLTGKGVTIAIIDAGFQYADKHPALERLRVENRILATKDFYDGGKNVYRHSDHGTQVLACLAGYYGETPLGAAYEANYLLARTEHESKESVAEEDHWIAALEWAVEQGADIVSTSVNFTDHHYTTAQMDGKTSAASKAAAIASQKGCLIVCAMGNEGDSRWEIMGAPADAPEVLSVGGSLPMLRAHIPFASIGPNAAGGLKPNVAGPAYVLTTGKKTQYSIQAGTSFACPLVAGIAACMLQKSPDLQPTQIISIMQRLGHHFPYYDFYLGFGVPDVRKIWTTPEEQEATFSIDYVGDTVKIQFPPLPDSTTQERVLSFHLENEEGVIENCYFSLIEPEETEYIFRRKERPGTLRIWFEGHLYQKKFE